MGPTGSESLRKHLSIRVIASYIFDWIILIAIGVVGFILSRVEPNKRPFSLVDPNIAYVLSVLAAHSHRAVVAAASSDSAFTIRNEPH